MLSFNEKNTDANERMKKKPTNERESAFKRMCIENDEKENHRT